VSEGERKEILLYRLTAPEKLILIPNGVEIPAQQPEEAEGPPFRIISMSRFDYQKNSGFLINIAQRLAERGRLADFQFIIAGEGEDRAEVLADAKRSGISGHLQCPGASPEPQTFFKGALCYLSSSRWEGMPLAVLEAMAHGLPAVVSDVTGNRDVVRNNETGFIYQEKDAEGAAEALCRLADDARLCKTLGAQAREYVQAGHNARRMARQTLNVLHEAKLKKSK
ncbi:MAG: glycosyltransferase, partial [Desulfovibrionaceae bacterium]|nr:glycosyltransferase [Desulfovibrionaceae bacterium]